jgi:hypothetical protein
VHPILQQYVELKPHEYVAATLWVLHTHVYDRFMVTPRLALTSPVRGCGKTTLLSLLERLVARADRTDSITTAAIYHKIDSEHPTLLIDEADNMGLVAQQNGTLRAIINGGHLKGTSRDLLFGGQPRKFSICSPMAYAAIGTAGILPLPLMQRSVMIRMERHGSERELKRFDADDAEAMAELVAIYRHIILWARKVTLCRNPEMPEEYRRSRGADNWRPLLSIADACSVGEVAREAAKAFAADYPDEDAAVTLLRDIRDLFNSRGTDRLASASIVGHLVGMDDAMWCEWRGARGDLQPRALSQAGLGDLLRPFGIRPKTIWPLNRRVGDKSSKGYGRSQFEQAWRSYCSDDTASQPSKVGRLYSV